MRKKLRHGVYIAGMAMESANRVASILSKKEPINHKIIYGIYKLGRLLKR